jgi:hypothetical protein
MLSRLEFIIKIVTKGIMINYYETLSDGSPKQIDCPIILLNMDQVSSLVMDSTGRYIIEMINDTIFKLAPAEGLAIYEAWKNKRGPAHCR